MQKVKLNIVPKGVKKTAYLSQNDNGRVVRYELFNELVPYTLDGSETITVTVVRPDGEEIVSSVPNTEEAYIDVTFNDDMSAIAGVGAGKITITDGETVLGSHNFDINVEIDAYNGKDVVIETETGTLLSFNTEVEDNALEYESEIPYNAEGYTGLRVINSRTAPIYNKTPYLFRKTPSGSGNSCIEKLNGLTVAYNQLCKSDVYSSSYNGITYTNNGDGSYTASGEVDNSDGSWFALTGGYAAVIGHVYFYEIFGNTETEFWEFGYAQQTRTKTAKIYKITGSNRFGLYIAYGTGNINETVKCICIDLTQMFGSAIADYIYSLEQATAGAGVSLFKSLGFDKPYYDYNAGSLKSSIPVAKKVIGFNRWSEKWKIVTQSNVDYFANADPIPVLPNTTYYFKTSAYASVDNVSSSGSYISYIGRADNDTFTTPDNCHYIRFLINASTYGYEYKNDICINFSDPALNGRYEPYKSSLYDLGGDTLRGILKLDDNNNIVAYGDIKTSDGNIKRIFGIVDLGTLDYTYSSGCMISSVLLVSGSSGFVGSSNNVICGKYIAKSSRNWASSYNDGECGLSVNGTQIVIKDSNYSDTATFKAAMSGKYLIYEVETPTTESSTPFDNPQEAGKTEEIIDGNVYGKVDLGSLEWTYNASVVGFLSNVTFKGSGSNSIAANMLCKKYVTVSWDNKADKTVFLSSTGALLGIKDSNYGTDAAAFKESLDGVYLYYEKSDSDGVEIPLGHNSIYGTDIEYIDIDFDTTIYGGDINAVDGKLSSEYNSDGSVKPTPEIIDITPALIPVRAGDNKIFNSADGDQTIRYYNQVE